MKKAVLVVASVILICGFAFGQTYKVLWNFGGPPNDGQGPVASLISDHAGNLYGTTQWGGRSTTNISGTVFELSPQPNGTWKETILYNFCTVIGVNGCLDGGSPQAGLILDARGNLYGTTAGGGTHDCPTGYPGCGTVFELSPPSQPGGAWTESVLYSFCAIPRQGTNSCLDGFHPVSQLAFDAAGNLYGTTGDGGDPQSAYWDFHTGVVFELTPGSNGWTETVLYSFCSIGGQRSCTDGAYPAAGVTFDKSGNLYGTTEYNGNTNFPGGAVYELSPGDNGWTETLLLAMQNSNNIEPEGTVALDPLGDLYTTFAVAGKNHGGGVLRLNLGTHALSTFSFNNTNGLGPVAGVLLDLKRKTLYATSYMNGGNTGYGTVFEIAASGQETNLYNFCPQPPACIDGGTPAASVIEDKSGNLYGTTRVGGAFGYGVVFEVTP